MHIQFTYEGRSYSVSFPDGVTEAKVTIPPFGGKSGNGKKPQIILTDRLS